MDAPRSRSPRAATEGPVCPVVVLEQWEYEYAAHIGIRRFTANWGRPDAAHYQRQRMEDDRTAQVAAAIAELAVAKHTNRYWPATIWPAGEHHRYRDRPDVGRDIEVKRVRSRDAAVRRHQVGKGLILCVAEPIAPEFREVRLLGWQHYDVAWELGVPADYSPADTRLVPRAALRPM